MSNKLTNELKEEIRKKMKMHYKKCTNSIGFMYKNLHITNYFYKCVSCNNESVVWVYDLY